MSDGVRGRLVRGFGLLYQTDPARLLPSSCNEELLIPRLVSMREEGGLNAAPLAGWDFAGSGSTGGKENVQPASVEKRSILTALVQSIMCR